MFRILMPILFVFLMIVFISIGVYLSGWEVERGFMLLIIYVFGGIFVIFSGIFGYWIGEDLDEKRN